MSLEEAGEGVDSGITQKRAGGKLSHCLLLPNPR